MRFNKESEEKTARARGTVQGDRGDFPVKQRRAIGEAAGQKMFRSFIDTPFETLHVLSLDSHNIKWRPSSGMDCVVFGSVL